MRLLPLMLVSIGLLIVALVVMLQNPAQPSPAAGWLAIFGVGGLIWAWRLNRRYRGWRGY